MRMRALHGLFVSAALALASAGCARVFGSYEVAPNGQAARDDELRRMLVSGQAADALTKRKAPDDEVLRALYRGVVAYYAEQYAESAQLFDDASLLADDRYTKSISRAALSLVSNDRVLPYEPGRTERLLIPYYGALARLKLGDVAGAAVEARRLGQLVQQYQDDGHDIDASLLATLRYVAAAVFAANGNRADADVAYRNVLAIDSLFGAAPHETADSAIVVVVLEQGFVAHRAEEGLAVMLHPEEVHALVNGDGDYRAAAASLVARRVLHHALYRRDYYQPGPYRRNMLHVPAPERSELPRRMVRKCTTVQPDSAQAAAGAQPREECREVEEEIDELPYLLKVAWPVYRTDYRPASGARVVCADDTVAFAPPADVSLGVVSDFEDERALIVARTIARGAAKFALTRGAQKELEEKNEAAGKIVGLLGNAGNVLLERADTRSWHLLPSGISVARLALAPGEHEISVELGDGTGRTVSLGEMVLSPGVTVIPVRLW